MLLDVLQQAPHLRYLDIGRNVRGKSEGVKVANALCNLCHYNPSLKSLSIAVFFRYLAQNTSLEELNFSFNKIGDRNFLEIVESLKVNKSLTAIEVDGNNISPAGYQALRYCLEFSNSTLKRMPFPRHDIKHTPKYECDELIRTLTDIHHLLQAHQNFV
jgi:hypothetical protein